MRLPRKLKKGCRTLNGKPRTKWQRKGRLHIAKTLQKAADMACAAAVGMNLLRQAAEMINPVTFTSGGIVVPPPPKVGVAQMPTGEMVLNREQIAKLKHTILVEPADSIRTTISVENMSDVLKRICERSSKEHTDKSTSHYKGTMNFGIIMVCIGFVLVYICMQIVPLYNLLSIFNKEECKKMKFEDWLFTPIFLLLLITPIVGMVIGLIFQDEDNKWNKCLVMIAIYIIIIGTIIAIIQYKEL